MKVKNFTKTGNNDWKVLEFVAPITEMLSDDNEFIIRGVAINETTTLNNVKYVAEELQKSTSSFRNVPILLDHENKVKNIVGRTTENVNFNDSLRRIEYEGKIMDKEIREMIKDGRIQNVSIGAKVSDLVEEEDGSLKAIGIHGLELSIVAVPGDGQASLAQALKDNYILKEKMMLREDSERREQDMENKKELLSTDTAKEEQPKEEPQPQAEEPKEEPVSEPTPEEKEEPVEEPKVEEPEETVEEPKSEEKANSDISEMRKEINEMKELLLAKKKLKEEAEMEKEDKTKGEVGEEATTEENNSSDVVIERASRGYALYRDYSKEAGNLKRLAR